MAQFLLSYLSRLKGFFPVRLRQNPWLVFFVVLVLLGLAVAGPSLAQQGIIGNFADLIIRAVSWIMLVIANLCIGLTVFFLRFFIAIASYNDYINVDVVQLGWIMVRDVANMFFVVALLVIAFGTILGLEEYEWKKNLVKLILAAILINFSNLIAQLIIDVAHVFTITFLNAISATAGGNLINMFKLDKITSMVGGQDPSGLDLEVLAGTIMAVVFAIIAAVAMGAYVFVMIMRVVALWALIILSPMAFILGVLPKTKAYADRWWSEFGKHVIVAPVMVFFLWLSFATLGNGEIASEINNTIPESHRLATGQGVELIGEANKTATLSLSEVTTWENMASFILAIAFMGIGIKVTQETGAYGAGAVGKALDFGKKVATIAAGYAAGRWLVGKAGEGAKFLGKTAAKGVGLGLYHMPGLDIAGRVERTKKGLKRQWNSFLGRTGYAMPFEMKVAKGGETVMTYEMKEAEEKGKVQAYELDAKTNKWVAKEKEVEKGGVYLAGVEKTLEKGDEYLDLRAPEKGPFGWLQRTMQKTAIKNIASEKMLSKTEKFLQTKKEILDSVVQGVPKGWFQSKDEDVDAMDRRYQGILKQLKARSAAKTEEYEALGAKLIGEMPRIQFKTKDGVQTKPSLLAARGSQIREMAQHKLNAKRYKNELTELEGTVTVEVAKTKEGTKAVKGAVAAERAAHLAAEKLKELTKEEETEFVRTDKRGKRVLAEEAEVAAKLSMFEDEIKASEAMAKKAFDATDESTYIDLRQAAANAQIVVAEQQIKKHTTEAKSRILFGTPFTDEEIDKMVADEKDEVREKKKKNILDALKTGHEATEEKYEFEQAIKLLEGAIKGREEEGLNNALRSEIAKAAEKLIEAEQLEQEASDINSPQAEEILKEANLDAKRVQIADLLQLKHKALEPLRDQRLQVIKRISELTDPEEKRIENERLFSIDARIQQVEAEWEQTHGTKVREIISEINVTEGKADNANQVWLEESKNTEIKEKRKKAQELRESQLAWRYAVATARATKARRGYSVAHNALLSGGEQQEIWGVRRIKMLTTALTENFEEYQKRFSNMSYEQFVSNFRDTLGAAIKARNENRAEEYFDDVTTGIHMGLFKHGVAKSWVDDIIISIWNNTEAQAEVKKRMPWWKTSSFSDKKINLIQSLIATNFDWYFVEQHDMIGDLYGAAAQYGMEEKDVVDGLMKGKFVDNNGRNVTEQILDDTRIKDRKNKIREKLLGQEDEVKKYLTTIRKSQPTFQAISDLREEVTGTTHPENGNHAREVTLKTGVKLHMPTGWERARDGMLGEERKVKLPQRSNHQSHAVAKVLTEDHGMVMLELDENKDRDMRDGVTGPNEAKDTTPRFINHFALLDAEGKAADYQDSNGRLVVLSPNNRTGAESNWLVAAEEEYKDLFDAEDEAVAKDVSAIRKYQSEQKIKTEDEALLALQAKRRLGLAGALAVQNVWAVKYRNIAADALMLLAKRSNILPATAQLEGKMNVAIPDREGNYIEFNTADDFVRAYNQGRFQMDINKYNQAETRPLVSYHGIRDKATAGKQNGPGGAGGKKPKGQPRGGGSSATDTEQVIQDQIDNPPDDD